MTYLNECFVLFVLRSYLLRLPLFVLVYVYCIIWVIGHRRVDSGRKKNKK